jgi:hypothetical protein
MSPAAIALFAVPGSMPNVTLPDDGHDPVALVPVKGLEKPLSPTRILLLTLNALPISAWKLVLDAVIEAAETAITRIARTTLAEKYQVNVRRNQW